MINRRRFLAGFAALALSGFASAGYAVGIEPFRLRVQRYRIRPTGWPRGLRLRIAALADLHACRPWMSPERIRYIVEQTNDLDPDLIVLLGDYVASHRFVGEQVHSREWSEALSTLSAPLGVHAILGNHDWWEDRTAQRVGHGPIFGQVALERVGIRVYENDAVRLVKDGRGFWLAGLGDQLALLPGRRWGRRSWRGVDDIPSTMAKITDNGPVIMMAHEPDILPKLPDRVCLTLAGHTHGGQVRLFGYSPIVPSRHHNRFAYGHVVEQSASLTGRPKHMIVSGGLGFSIMPVRFGVPPEIVVVDIGAS